jgi:hypothetical protein
MVKKTKGGVFEQIVKFLNCYKGIRKVMEEV